MRILSPGCTNLKIQLDHQRYRWISNRGMPRIGQSMILLAGELANYPASIAGTLAADFALNVNTVTDMDMSPDLHPVTVQIEANRIADFHCDNLVMQAFLSKCFADSKAWRVGELGFGTNPRVQMPIPLNSHINEGCPGVHIGIGQDNQSGVLPYNCDQHLDSIAKGALVWIDEAAQPLNVGRLTPERVAHPQLGQEEDFFSPKTVVDETDCWELIP